MSVGNTIGRIVGQARKSAAAPEAANPVAKVPINIKEVLGLVQQVADLAQQAAGQGGDATGGAAGAPSTSASPTPWPSSSPTSGASLGRIPRPSRVLPPPRRALREGSPRASSTRPWESPANRARRWTRAPSTAQTNAFSHSSERPPRPPRQSRPWTTPRPWPRPREPTRQVIQMVQSLLAMAQKARATFKSSRTSPMKHRSGRVSIGHRGSPFKSTRRRKLTPAAGKSGASRHR